MTSIIVSHSFFTVNGESKHQGTQIRQQPIFGKDIEDVALFERDNILK